MIWLNVSKLILAISKVKWGIYAKKIQCHALFKDNLYQCKLFVFESSLSFVLLSKYTNRFVEEINDLLTVRGLVPMNELIRQYDLPIEYVHSIVTDRIVGAPSRGVKCKSGILYTKNYVHLQQNILMGCFEAAFHPIRVIDIIKLTGVNENLVQSKYKHN